MQEFNDLTWASDRPMPSVGDKIHVTMNGLGYATVIGFFVEKGSPETNYIGLKVEFLNPPEWFLKHNGGNVPGYVFPRECEGLHSDNPTDEEKQREDERREFVGFLTDTLIPDLRECGRDCTADDFEKCVGFMS